MKDQNLQFDNDHLNILKQFAILEHLDTSNKELVDEECAKLLNLMVSHFICEEYYMLNSNYKDFIVHRCDHNRFYEHISRFCSLITEINESTFNTQLTKIVLAFKHHVNNTDSLFFNATHSEELKKQVYF